MMQGAPRFSSLRLLVVIIAPWIDRTDRALGLARMAQLAPEANQVEVRRAVFFCREELCQYLVRFLHIHFWWAQADPPADPVNVCVDRKSRHAEGKDQNNRGCLRADSLEPGKPGARILNREIFEKIKVQSAGFLADLAQDGLDARTFLVCQSSSSNGL